MPQEKQQAVAPVEKALTKYIPFGSDSEVKLSIAIVKDLICVPTKSGKVCSDKDALKFIAMCQARKLNPFEGDAFLLGYDSQQHGPQFSLITAHQAFLKRAELNPQYDGMESGVVVEEKGEIKDIVGDFVGSGQKLLGGWARVFFKNRAHPMYKRIRLERFKKPFGIWLDDPAGMICKCAEADALRSSFPTMLGGLYMREESPTQAIEIVDAKVETPAENGDRMRAALDRRETERLSNGKGAASGGASPTAAPEETSQPPSSSVPKTGAQQDDNQTSAAPSSQPAAPPVRKTKKKLQPKEEPAPPITEEMGPNRSKLNRSLSIGGYTEDQFLEVCNKNEWLGKGRKWDNMSDVPDDMLELFIDPEEFGVVVEQLQKMFPDKQEA